MADRPAVDVEPIHRNARADRGSRPPATRTPRSVPTGRCRRPSGPCVLSSLGTANTGPMPISSGSQPGDGVAAEDEQRLHAERLARSRASSRPSPTRRRTAATSCRPSRCPGRSSCRTPAAASPAPRSSCRRGCTRRARRGASSSPTFWPVFLSRTARVTWIGASSPAKNAVLLARAVRCWLLERELVLRLAADRCSAWRPLRPCRPSPCRRRQVLDEPWVRRAVALHHRDRLDAAADRGLHAFVAGPCAPPGRSPAGPSCSSGSR